MKVKYKSVDGRLEVELDGDQKTIFKNLASFQEVFDRLSCGKCHKKDIRFLIRKATDEKKKKDYDYYELRCNSCQAKFQFGQSEDGEHLFPKNKDEDGNWKPDGGWTKYNKETGKEE